MNDKEKLENWKRKLVEIDSKARKISNEKTILTNLLNEVKTRQNIKLNNTLRGLDLVEEINHLKDWIRFHENEISIYKKKINPLETELSRQEILDQELEELDNDAERILEREKDLEQEPIETFKADIPATEELEKDAEEGVEEEKKTKPEFMIGGQYPVKEDEKEIAAIIKLFDIQKQDTNEEEVRSQIKELFRDKVEVKRPSLKEKLASYKHTPRNTIDLTANLNKNKFVLYSVPIVLLLLISGVLFLSQPEITGYITLTQEKTYEDNLNLIMNESGNYTWTVDQGGIINSIKASGRVKGNGTVKVYIEKDGERYLIYDNKK